MTSTDSQTKSNFGHLSYDPLLRLGIDLSGRVQEAGLPFPFIPWVHSGTKDQLPKLELSIRSKHTEAKPIYLHVPLPQPSEPEYQKFLCDATYKVLEQYLRNEYPSRQSNPIFIEFYNPQDDLSARLYDEIDKPSE